MALALALPLPLFFTIIITITITITITMIATTFTITITITIITITIPSSSPLLSLQLPFHHHHHHHWRKIPVCRATQGTVNISIKNSLRLNWRSKRMSIASLTLDPIFCENLCTQCKLFSFCSGTPHSQAPTPTTSFFSFTIPNYPDLYVFIAVMLKTLSNNSFKN